MVDSPGIGATGPASRPTTPMRLAGRFVPGVSGNPGGRPHGERSLLAQMYGKDGRKVFTRLERLRNDPQTPRRLKAQIDFFLVERLFGRAAQLIGVEGGPNLTSLILEAAARITSERQGLS